MASHDNEKTSQRNTSQEMNKPNGEYKWKIVWHLLFGFTAQHAMFLIGIYLLITGSVMWQTILFAIFLDVISLIGMTAGAHRLWSHRSYKAKLPLRILLAFFFSLAGQYTIFNWVKDHRMHHKYSETDADPHNAKRGFFFCHIGWFVVEKHPEYIKKEKLLDLSDLHADRVVEIQRKYSVPIISVCYVIIPIAVPVLLWGETVINSHFIAAVVRHVFALHQTCLVNSAAHMWGNRPYDRHINPAENYWVNSVIYGEGFHNYHHTFPWDYSASELGFRYNLTTVFINLMEWIGQAYDLKRVSAETILNRKKRTGESGKHRFSTTSED